MKTNLKIDKNPQNITFLKIEITLNYVFMRIKSFFFFFNFLDFRSDLDRNQADTDPHY